MPTNNFNYGNALFVTKPHHNYIETITIRGYARDDAVNHRYLQYLSNIDLFLTEFVARATPLIAEAEKNKFLVNEEEIKPLATLSLSSAASSTKLISKKILHPTTGKPFLTKRETECMQELVLGKTTKAIANTLQLSPRTIERHLDNIKIKLKIRYKSEILSLISKLEHNRLTLYNKVYKG